MIVEEACKVLSENWANFLVHGPGLRCTTQACVLAKDSEHGMVLLGGLGGCGIGEMWFEDTEERQRLPGYADAPENPNGRWFKRK